MASGRFLSTSIAEDDRLSKLSLMAEFIYLKTIPHLDRDGMISGKPGLLYSRVCPTREEMFGNLLTLIDEWVKIGLAVRFDSPEGPVLFFPGFLKNNNLPHYDRERASKFPPPPGYYRAESGIYPVGVEPPEKRSKSRTISDTEPPINDGAIQDEVQDSLQDEVQDFDLQEQEQEQEQEEDQDQDKDHKREEEKTRARDPLTVAWEQTYEGVEMPPKLLKNLQELVAECGMAATIHGIKASAAKKDGRNFRYIAECARNYVPPPPVGSVIHRNGNGRSYHVDLPVREADSVPGVYALTPPAQLTAPPPLPPPMAHDDPWAVALGELLPTLSTQAAEWLKDSVLSGESELAGEPFYQVLVSHPKADMQWLKQQLEVNVRRKLRTLIGYRVNVAFVHVAANTPPAPAAHATRQEVTR